MDYGNPSTRKTSAVWQRYREAWMNILDKPQKHKPLLLPLYSHQTWSDYELEFPCTLRAEKGNGETGNIVKVYKALTGLHRLQIPAPRTILWSQSQSASSTLSVRIFQISKADNLWEALSNPKLNGLPLP